MPTFDSILQNERRFALLPAHPDLPQTACHPGGSWPAVRHAAGPWQEVGAVGARHHNTAVARQHVLAARTAAELAAALQAETAQRDPEAPLFLPRGDRTIDSSTERPRCASTLLPRQAARPYYQECDRCGCAWAHLVLERNLGRESA